MLKNEIKNELDRRPQYREMLFRRGYLLTDASINDDVYPFYGMWKKTLIGSYSLYVQEKQTCFICEQGQQSIALVGHAYNPFTMEWDENAICSELLTAYQQGLSVYFDKVSELTGLHVIIVVDHETIIVCQDACSLTG